MDRNKLKLLKKNKNFKFLKVNTRDKKIERLKKIDIIYHLAAQVTVTLSVEKSIEDFEVNLLGTLNLLEATHKSQLQAFFMSASTNKVYGGMEYIKVEEKDGRCSSVDYSNGIDESFNLDFYSSYDSSKATADIYIRDYSGIYRLNTVVVFCL